MIAAALAFLLSLAQWAWSWLSSVLLAVAAELLLTRFRRRWRKQRRAARGKGRHRVVEWRVGQVRTRVPRSRWG